MGIMYRDGNGVSRDAETSFKWFLKAAENGDPHAQYAVGLALYDGAGTQRDRDQAIDWWIKSANQGHTNAQFNVAQYWWGEYEFCGERSFKKNAIKYMQMAAEGGDEDAMSYVTKWSNE